MTATYWLPPAVVSKLIEQGAEVNIREDRFGRTPLMSVAAADQGNLETLHILLEKGADPNIADADGETPLDWAMHARHEGKIALLRKYSVKVGDTPRDRTYGKPEGIADPRTSLTPRGGRPAASSRSGVPVSTTALATSPAFLTKGEQMANMNCVRRKAGRHRPPRPSSSGPSGETLSAVLRATRNSLAQ